MMYMVHKWYVTPCIFSMAVRVVYEWSTSSHRVVKFLKLLPILMKICFNVACCVSSQPQDLNIFSVNNWICISVGHADVFYAHGHSHGCAWTVKKRPFWATSDLAQAWYHHMVLVYVPICPYITPYHQTFVVKWTIIEVQINNQRNELVVLFFTFSDAEYAHEMWNIRMKKIICIA